MSEQPLTAASNKPAHTPGPWTWMETPSAHGLDYPHDAPDKPWDGKSPLDSYPSFDDLRGPNGEHVLVGVWCNDSTAEVGVHNEADARLIAAAPDLLAVCKSIQARFYADGTYDYLLDAAIAKAEG